MLAGALASGDVDAAEVRSVLAKAEAASPDDRRLLFEAVGEAGPNAIRVASDLDDLASFYRFVEAVDAEELALIAKFDDRQTLRRFFELEVEGVNSATLDSLRANLADLASGDVQAHEVERFTANVYRLENVDVDVEGVDRIVQAASKANVGGFKGLEFEADYASHLLNDGTEVIALRKPIDISRTSSRPNDLDVVSNEDGRTVATELKRSDKFTDPSDIGDLDVGFEELVDEGLIDSYRIVFKRLPEDSSLRDIMKSRNIQFEVIGD